MRQTIMREQGLLLVLVNILELCAKGFMKDLHLTSKRGMAVVSDSVRSRSFRKTSSLSSFRQQQSKFTHSPFNHSPSVGSVADVAGQLTGRRDSLVSVAGSILSYLPKNLFRSSRDDYNENGRENNDQSREKNSGDDSDDEDEDDDQSDRDEGEKRSDKGKGRPRIRDTLRRASVNFLAGAFAFMSPTKPGGNDSPVLEKSPSAKWKTDKRYAGRGTYIQTYIYTYIHTYIHTAHTYIHIYLFLISRFSCLIAKMY